MGQRGKVVARNKKAYHDYHIEETLEAGIILQGTEVKSIRRGSISIKDGYARVENGEVFMYNVHIAPYEQGNRFNHEPERKRKLLLNKREIRRLIGYVKTTGYTLVPLRVYFNNRNLVKIDLGIAKGKKMYDKRRDLAEKTAQRQIERAMRERQKD